jgi:two-component system, NtrC family, response regulator AtoC
MSASLQARLMHVLQDKVLLIPGSDRAIPLDVRVLAATSASLERALAERKLREDLYYRLSAFTVQVPPLRQRKSEISILLHHTMQQMARQYGLPTREFSPAALDACQQYAWPGNLRELENFVKRYLVAGDKELNFYESSLGDGTNGRHSAGMPEISFASSSSSSMRGEAGDEQGPKSLKSLIQSVKYEAERNAIGSALQKTGWNRKAAARLLRVSYRTLLYKIDQYHMSASESFLSPLPGGRVPYQTAASKSNGKTS